MTTARAPITAARLAGTRKVAIALGAAAAFAVPFAAAAQGVDVGWGYADAIGLPSMDIRETASNLIRSLLGFLGLMLVIMILWSGFRLMTAGGDAEKEDAAKMSLRNAIVGFLLIMMSVSLTRFIVGAISQGSYGVI